MMLKEYYLPDLDATKKLAISIIKYLEKGTIVSLKGTLGSGKTTFARFLINELLGKEEKVVSPTYNIVKIYQNADIKIYHYDLYRLRSKNEAQEIGLEEAISEGITIIEWPEIIESLLKNQKVVELNFLLEENERHLKINLLNI